MQFIYILGCVTIVVAVVAFIAYLKGRARFHAELSQRMLLIEAGDVFLASQIRALMLLSSKLWKESSVPMPDGKPFEEVLQTLTAEQTERFISMVAKSDPVKAAQLREVVKQCEKAQNPFGKHSPNTALEPTATAPPDFCGARKYDSLDSKRESSSSGRGSALDR